MARAGVVVAVTAMLVGSTGAGVLAGAVLVAGSFWAYTAIDGRSTPPTAAPAYATASPVRPAVEAPPANTATLVTAGAPLPATPAAATAPSPSTTSSSPARSSGTSSTTRSPKPAPKPAATSSGDLLADEDEWEALGFEKTPAVAPGNTRDEEVGDDEELDELLEDLDAAPRPKRGR